jgi:hypothetical protein
MVNAAKGDADPSNWLPPTRAYQCTYLADRVAIKGRWGLSMDESEYGRILKLLRNQCPDQLIAPWPDTPPAVTTTTTTTTTTTAAAPPIQPAVPPIPAAPPPRSNCDPSYPGVCIPPPPPDLDCGDIPFDHFRVLQPDPHGFDGEGDGVGCESYCRVSERSGVRGPHQVGHSALAQTSGLTAFIGASMPSITREPRRFVEAELIVIEHQDATARTSRLSHSNAFARVRSSEM